MGLHLALYDTADRLMADWSSRVQRFRFGTNEHGFAACSGLVPMTLRDAFHWYERPGLPRVVVSDGAGIAWEGRLEEVSLVPGGIQFAAFGYWRALSDLLYTAVWSTTTYDWLRITEDQIATALEGRFEQDNDARLYISPKLEELHGSAVEAFWGYVPPSDQNRTLLSISFDYDLDVPAGSSGWHASLQERTAAWGYVSTPWQITSAGSTLTGSAAVALATPARLVFALRYNAAEREYAAPFETVTLTETTNANLADHQPGSWTFAGGRWTAYGGFDYNTSNKGGATYSVGTTGKPITTVRFSYTMDATVTPGKWKARLIAANDDYSDPKSKWTKAAGSEPINETVEVSVGEAERVWLEFFYDDPIGINKTVANTQIEAIHGTPVTVPHTGLVPGSVVVESALTGAVYAEGTDYTVDVGTNSGSGFTEATITALSTGAIPNYYPVLVSYQHKEQSVSNEIITADIGVAVALDHSKLKSGSVTVTNIGSAVTTYQEQDADPANDPDDYSVDYLNGTITALSGGAIVDGQYLKVAYTYTSAGYDATQGDTYFQYHDFTVQPKWDTGEHSLKITNIRIKSTAAAAVYPSDIAASLVSYVNTFNPDQLLDTTALVEAAAVDLRDAEWQDATPADVLDELAQMGNGVSLYETGVWEGRRLYFRERDSQARTFLVDVTELELGRILDSMANRVYATFEDDFLGTQRTPSLADTASVSRYGVTRTAVAESSTTALASAEQQRDAMLEVTKTITPRARISFSRIYDESGARAPLWEVRAGDILIIRNLPPTLGTTVNGVQVMRLVRTEYRADDDELIVEPEVTPPTLEALLAEAIK